MTGTSDDQRPGATPDVDTADSREAPVQLASLAAALMVKAAKGDGEISRAETDEMLETLRSRLGMRSADAMGYLAEAVSQLHEPEHVEAKLRTLAAGLSREERTSAFSMMLGTVMADGRLAPGEHEAVVGAGKLLEIPVETIYAELKAARGG